MNHSLKHWREAATLIVAAELRLCAGGSRAENLPHTGAFDYKTLMLKRKRNSGFMPSAYVFPGGHVDATDFSCEWLDIFSSFRSNPHFGLRRVKQSPQSRPCIFATDRLSLGSPIPGDVAFRICALRETFEESGILLIVPKPEEKRVLDSKEFDNHSVTDICSAKELNKWRVLVNESPCNFIKMCKELEVLPNIWALHEWSNWLTPESRYNKRFDTAFYICCLKEMPYTLEDQKEIELFQWSTPSEVLQSFEAEKLFIGPPQFYELSRLCHFLSLTDLHKFASDRAIEGCEHFLPVITVQDGQLLSLLPGDKLYPMNTSDSTTKDGGSALHRVVMESSYKIRLQINITPKYNHLVPVLQLNAKSHL